jgi:hypothetical protein
VTASDGAANDRFGSGVDIADGTLVVGARQLDGQGAVYVFTNTDGTWTETTKLTASDGGRIGHSVALHDDLLVAGSERGTAYVFERANGAWTEATKLIPAEGFESGPFDSPVDISDGWIAVGAFGQAEGPQGVQGRVFLFHTNSPYWTPDAVLKTRAADPAGDLLGWDVALQGGSIVVGAPGAEGGQGATYQWVYAAGRWVALGKTTAPDGVEGDSFGSAIARGATVRIVGASGAGIESPATDQGGAYMYAGASQPEKLIAEDGAPGDRFGASAAVAAGIVILGAPGADVGQNVDQGAVYVSDQRFQLYFAEGATGFFQTDVSLFHPSYGSTNVLVRLNPTDGSGRVEVPVTLGDLGRYTIDVNRALGDRATGVWIQIWSDTPIVATRQMRWGSPTWGSTLENSALDRSEAWYFAEGSTAFSNLFYVIANPNAAAANVTIQYLRSGGAPIAQEVVVPARERRTIWANAVPGLGSTQVGAVISADRPVVAERTMYAGEGLKMGTTSLGAPALSSQWLFAEGETSLADTFLALANPGDAAAEVTVDFRLADGDLLTKTYEVPATSRRTIFVDHVDPALASTTLTMKVSSNVPIVAERAMWWGPTLASWYEGHVTLGATEAASDWAIGEGTSGGPDAEDTHVLVRSEDSEDAEVLLTVVLDDGRTLDKEFAIPAFGRLTVRVQDEFPEVGRRRFSILVEHGGFIGPLTVEYARYQSTLGRFGNGGGVALATRLPIQ